MLDIMKQDGTHYGTAYLRCVAMRASLRLTVDFLIALIKESRVEFDTIAFRGFSGGLVAPTIALALDKHILAIRKPKSDENTHSGCYAEGNIGIERYIIIDDFICTGETIRKIAKEIRRIHHNVCQLPPPKCAAIFCYASSSNYLKYDVTDDLTVPIYHFCLDGGYTHVERVGRLLPEFSKYPQYAKSAKKPSFDGWLKSAPMRAVFEEMRAKRA